jgi:hypothetical protein
LLAKLHEELSYKMLPGFVVTISSSVGASSGIILFPGSPKTRILPRSPLFSPVIV